MTKLASTPRNNYLWTLAGERARDLILTRDHMPHYELWGYIDAQDPTTAGGAVACITVALSHDPKFRSRVWRQHQREVRHGG